MKQTFIFFLCASIIGMATIVSAHSSGVSFEDTKEGYKIDIGHAEFFAAGESTRFDFTLYPEDIENIEGDIFTDVWVTITQDKKLFFAGGIDKPVFGATGFTYLFPEAGTYVLSARYQKDGDSLVQTEFPIEVTKAVDAVKKGNPLFLYLALAIGGVLAGFGAGVIVRKNKKV